MSKPSGTVCCILCRGMVAYRNRNKARFVKHMENEHGAYFDLEFVLATCFMEEDEKMAVKNVIESKHVDDSVDIVDIDTVEIKKEPIVDTEVNIEPVNSVVPLNINRGLKRSHKEASVNNIAEKNTNLVPIKEEPVDNISPVKENPSPKTKVLKQDNANKNIIALPVEIVKTDKNKYICTHCEASFEKEEYLKIHVKIMHSSDSSKSRFYCTECDTSFSRKDVLNLHKKRKHPEKISLTELTENNPTVNFEEPSDKPTPSSTVDEIATISAEPVDESLLGNKVSTDKNTDICVLCNETFTHKIGLTRHNKRVHDVIDAKQCPQCEKTFTRTDNLNKHIKSVHPDSVESDKCDQCDYSNPRKDRLKRHKETTHPSNDVNDKISPRKTVERTIPVKTMEQSKPKSDSLAKPKYITNYPCDKCDKVFSMRETILDHVKTAHGIIVPNLANKSETDKKAQEEKRKREVTKFWQTKAKQLEDSDTADESSSSVDDTVSDYVETAGEDLDNVAGDLVNVYVSQAIPKIEKDDGPLARVVISNVDVETLTYSPMELDFDPLGSNSEDVDDPEPIEDAKELKNITMDEGADDPESADESVSSDELEIETELENEETEGDREKHDLNTEKKLIDAVSADNASYNQENTNADDQEITVEESTSYLQIDISKSKYFKMNSYAICSLDLYTSGVEGDFEDCFDLPESWKFKTFGPESNPKKSTHFITPDMKVIKSRLGAIEYLRLSGKFSRQELWEYSKYLDVPDRRFDKLF